MVRQIIIAAVALAAPAAASDWVPVSGGAGHDAVLVDMQSVETTGSARRAWVQYVNEKVAADRVERSKNFVKVDCNAHTFQILSSVDYAKDGSVIRSAEFSELDGVMRIVPDSVGQLLQGALCK